MGHWIEICKTQYGLVAVDGVVYGENGPGRFEVSKAVADIAQSHDVAGKYCQVEGNEIVGFNLRSQAPGFGKDTAGRTE